MKTGLFLGRNTAASPQPAREPISKGPVLYWSRTLLLKPNWSRHAALIICVLLLGIAILRIVATYRVFSQAYDEPADVVSGMEWLDKGTYTLNLLHPPLSPVATAVGPYLAGIRLQQVPVIQGPKGPFFDLSTGGNNIFNFGGKYWRNLILARMGILPFLVLGILVVFFWTRELVGTAPAVMAVALFTTLPSILAFSGLAYTDVPVAVLVLASAYIFTHWIERPSLRMTLALGSVTALAVLSNFPAVLYIPACWAAVLVAWYGFGKKTARGWSRLLRQSVVVALTFFVVLWAGYRFSVEPLSEVVKNPQNHVAALRAPAAAKRVLQEIVTVNPPVPAPSLVRGILAVKHDTGHGRESYLFGQSRLGGWWYFYLIVLLVKTPLPFLLLAVVGAVAMIKSARRLDEWKLLAPSFCVLGLLLVTMPVKVNYGVRHILCVYIPLAALAGYGTIQLWVRQRWHWPARVVLVGLLGWQILSSARAHPDYITNMNELAGRHPENVLLWGCDYDCGQDTARLGLLLQQHHVEHVSLAIFSSVDYAKLGFPSVDVLTPYQQPSGWVAGSVRMIRTGDAFWGGSHPDGFEWLASCRPVDHAGKTIYLYYLPCERSP